MPARQASGERGVERSSTTDLASGLCAPLANAPDSLVRAEQGGLLVGPSIQKLTLVNYVTPAIVRAIEYVAALCPDLPHVFLTSGRDELIDKAIRLLKWHRKQAHTVISLSGAYVGHTTAAARSVSDRLVHRQGAPISRGLASRIPRRLVKTLPRPHSGLRLRKRAGGCRARHRDRIDPGAHRASD